MKRVALLIDGYNLLHATGLFGRGGRSSLETSRDALVGFLAAAIDRTQHRAATIVFDAAHAPPGLPSRYHVGEIEVYFARGYDSADALLEELIAAHPTPRKLVVVSSDHRVQRAAQRRRATAIDSHLWYHQTAAALRENRHDVQIADFKPGEALTPGEVADWLRFFESPPAPDTATQVSPTDAKRAGKRTRSKPAKKSTRKRPKSDERPAAKIAKPARRPPASKRGKPQDLGFGDIANPFPPGYGVDD